MIFVNGSIYIKFMNSHILKKVPSPLAGEG
jgi:hypothetical protein